MIVVTARSAWDHYCGRCQNVEEVSPPQYFASWVYTLGTSGFGAGSRPWLPRAAALAASTAVELAALAVGHDEARQVARLARVWIDRHSAMTAAAVTRTAEKMSPPFATEKDARILVEWAAFMLGELVLEPGPDAVEHAATAAHFAIGAVARHEEDPSLFLAEVKRRVHGWALPMLEPKGQ